MTLYIREGLCLASRLLQRLSNQFEGRCTFEATPEGARLEAEIHARETDQPLKNQPVETAPTVPRYRR